MLFKTTTCATFAHIRTLALFSLSALLLWTSCQSTRSTTQASSNSLQGLVHQVREQYKMPGMAAAVIRDGKIETVVSGVRRIDQPDPILVDDRFQLGSATKVVTAHWAGTLVDAGAIQWDTKLLEVFPEWKDDALKTYHRITLSDLLAHRGYVQPFTSAEDMARIPRFGGGPMEQRRALGQWLLRQNPARVGGKEGYTYSHAGYALAAAMLEKVSGTTWENGIVEDILLPMGIDAHVGWPTDRNPAQPYGHHARHPLDTNLRPVTSVNMFPIPTALAPAVSLCTSVEDYARFVQHQLQGLSKGGALNQTTYEYIHRGRDLHAMGWTHQVKNGIHISAHDGSSGTFYTHTSIYQEKKLALLIFVNASNVNATKAVYSLKKRLVERYEATVAPVVGQ